MFHQAHTCAGQRSSLAIALCRVLVVAVTTTLASHVAMAAPVLHESVTSAPVDLQVMVERWTDPGPWQPSWTVPPAAPIVLPAPSPASWSPFRRLDDTAAEGTADPMAFALLGGALLVAGLAVRAVARRQRGLS